MKPLSKTAGSGSRSQQSRPSASRDARASRPAPSVLGRETGNGRPGLLLPTALLDELPNLAHPRKVDLLDHKLAQILVKQNGRWVAIDWEELSSLDSEAILMLVDCGFMEARAIVSARWNSCATWTRAECRVSGDHASAVARFVKSDVLHMSEPVDGSTDRKRYRYDIVAIRLTDQGEIARDVLLKKKRPHVIEFIRGFDGNSRRRVPGQIFVERSLPPIGVDSIRHDEPDGLEHDGGARGITRTGVSAAAIAGVEPASIGSEAAPSTKPAAGLAFETTCQEDAKNRGDGTKAWRVAKERGEEYIRNHPFPGVNELARRSRCHPETMKKAITQSETLRRARVQAELGSIANEPLQRGTQAPQLAGCAHGAPDRSPTCAPSTQTDLSSRANPATSVDPSTISIKEGAARLISVIPGIRLDSAMSRVSREASAGRIECLRVPYSAKRELIESSFGEWLACEIADPKRWRAAKCLQGKGDG
ncbi:MAG: hypothetical protein IT430_19860 [Phycisphaerales bacterium]|nr:hypothetical protein [Phycisphaerales bacterium]